MRRRGRPSRLAPAILLAGLFALAFSASASATATWSAASPVVSARSALRFWTPARMRQARPLEATPPAGGGLARASALAEGADPATAAASDFVPVADPTAPGFRQNGAVFIVLPHGQGFGRCSGTSVDAPNRSVVITAGHCVNEGGPGHWFNREWVFVPGYHDGVRPF